MHDQLAEKFAELFAKCAATGDASELRKEAAAHSLVKQAEGGVMSALTNPLVVAPVLGAAGGGLAGYYGTKKDKNKKRNAIYGALTGGLGGLGGALLLPQAKALLASEGSSGKGGGGGADADGKPTDWTTNSVKAPRTLADILGFGAGARAGGRAAGKAYDARYPARAGELKRLAKEPKQPGLVGKMLKGGPKKNEYAKPLTELFDAHRAGGRSVAESLNDIAAHPGKRPVAPMRPDAQGIPVGTPEYMRSMDIYNTAQPAYEARLKDWQKAMDTFNADRAALPDKLQRAERLMQPKADLGTGADRARNVEVLAEMLRKRGLKINGTGTLHTDLGKVQNRTGGRVARGAGGIAGGVAGGLVTDYLTSLLQNQVARAVGAAPTLNK